MLASECTIGPVLLKKKGNKTSNFKVNFQNMTVSQRKGDNTNKAYILIYL
jgi:hypothetical protein